MRRIIPLVTVVLVMAVLLPGMALAQSNAAQPVDPPQQVTQLRQQYQGLTPQQIEAAGYAPEGPCVPNPQGAGGMGIHAINGKLLEAQFPNGTMDPRNPPVLLLDENSKVIGVEWEAEDVGQGPMKMFDRTIQIQPGHPGVEHPHYMMHIYFKPDGKVLFGTDPQTEFDPALSCPPMSATAAASVSPSAGATATPTATSSASPLAETGGAFSLTLVGPLALLLVGAGTGVLAFRVVRRG